MGDRRGVLKDEAEAVRWFRLAAEQGVADAQNNLGAMYGTGKGVLKDFVLARRFAPWTTPGRFERRAAHEGKGGVGPWGARASS